jgi:DNA-binding response OmpR family regulator
MKIVIVEDDGVSRLVLETKLKKLGHEVIATRNGEEGWQAFVQEQPLLVITDWMMPELDGLQLSRKIRAGGQKKYTYIIMLTALAGKKNYLEGMNAGVDDFLNKPVDMDELTARLRVAERILALESEVKQLEGLLPICAYCKKIRDNNNEWEAIEGYISKRTEAQFSHGFCPTCYEQHVAPQLEQLKLDMMAGSI